MKDETCHFLAADFDGQDWIDNITMPISFKGRVVQYAGRLHRKYKGKTDVKIYDYVDANIPILRRMYEKRLKTYDSMGYLKLEERNNLNDLLTNSLEPLDIPGDLSKRSLSK